MIYYVPIRTSPDLPLIASSIILLKAALVNRIPMRRVEIGPMIKVYACTIDTDVYLQWLGNLHSQYPRNAHSVVGVIVRQ
jgi:hypothetical protein